MQAKPPSSQAHTRALGLVTGAGRRLGRAIALELAEGGLDVAIHYFHSESEAQETAKLVQKLGQAAYLVQADLRHPEEITRLFAKVASLPCQLEVLVNSAAEMKRGKLMELKADEWDSVMALNLRAPMLCSQAAARLMDTTGGHIINISDVGARKAWTGYPAYIVSKAGLEALTHLLARDLAPGIRVNGIAPGLVLPSKDIGPDDWERLIRRVPMQRAANIKEITQTLSFLLDNPYITGEIITVDGGYRLG